MARTQAGGVARFAREAAEDAAGRGSAGQQGQQRLQLDLCLGELAGGV